MSLFLYNIWEWLRVTFFLFALAVDWQPYLFTTILWHYAHQS